MERQPIPIDMAMSKHKSKRDQVPYKNYSVDLLDYLDQIRAGCPVLLTADFLVESGAPMEFIALLRGKARSRLLEGMRDDHYWEYAFGSKHSIEEIILGLVKMNCAGEVHVGDIEHLTVDSGESNTYAFPIEWSSGGVMTVEVNDAWGVHWRFGSFAQVPMLQQVQHEYDPQKTMWIDKSSKSIMPSTLAQSMKLHGVNVEQLAHQVHQCMGEHIGSMKSTVEYYGKDTSRFDRRGARLAFGSPEHTLSIAFELGAVYGDKSVIISDEENDFALYNQVHLFDSLQNLNA